jgi:septal ring factor EnvC (AmiA/AmiB activator)
MSALFVGMPSRAQDSSSQDAQIKLKESQQKLEESRRHQVGVQTDVEKLATEREEISKRLVETAAHIQASEGKMTAIEARIGELGAQERALKSSLARRHGQISHLLAAMQRMGRNPPPVIVTRREDALQMVRSAMLLARAFPELRDQALALAERLNEIARIMDSIKSEGARLKAETARLAESQIKLSAIMESKRQSMSERQDELARLHKEQTEITANVRELSDLITRLDRAVSAHTGLGAYEAERKAAAEPKSTATATTEMPAVSGPAPAVRPPVKGSQTAAATPPPSAEPAGSETRTDAPTVAPPVVVAMGPPAMPLPPGRPDGSSVVELSPKSTLASFSPGRLKPAMPFTQAKGFLPLPAHGKRIIAFGEKTQIGNAKGIFIETRHGARVVSACDGWVVYAGVFRSLGQLLIINAGDGYHVVLAGMSQIDVQLGQFVVAGEPVGVMGAAPKSAAIKIQDTSPVLYVEFRKGDEAINPDPWWAGKPEKVQE